MNDSPRTLYQGLRRRPSASVVPSDTTSLTTSQATSGLVPLPNGPYMSLRVSATLKMWSCSRVRRMAWSASLVVSGVPSSCWKNQAGVWLCQTSVWP